MHYKTKDFGRQLEPVEKFLKEMGVKEAVHNPSCPSIKLTYPPASRLFYSAIDF